jgi:hypothetical protein
MGEWRQDLQVVTIVGSVSVGQELMNMVTRRWLVEVNKRYLNLAKLKN